VKALAYILVITVVSASVFADENKDELDGKALECLHGKLPVSLTNCPAVTLVMSRPLGLCRDLGFPLPPMNLSAA